MSIPEFNIEIVKQLDLVKIEHLVKLSRNEEFSFLDRLITEWKSGMNQFNKPNERLYLILKEKTVVGIGGINQNPYRDDRNIGRIRHLYIHPNYRRQGIGKKLIQTILTEFRESYKIITLRTDNQMASEFYKSVGFEQISHSKTDSHIKILH